MIDLSKEYNPVPKPLPRVKMPKAMKKEGKKTISWADERKKLVQKFTAMGVTTCELQLKGCWKNTALGFAHKAKRRKLGVDDLGEVALLCTPCHESIEYVGAGEMQGIIEDIIKNRKVTK